MTGNEPADGLDVEAVRTAGRKLLDTSTRRVAADKAAAAIRDVVGKEYVQIYLENDDPPLLMGAASTAAASDRFDFQNLVESPDGALGEALETGETVVRTGPDAAPTEGPQDAGSWCVVPLDGEGAIVVLTPDEAGFSEEAITGIDIVGTYFDAAIKQFGASAEEHTGDARLEALSRAFPDYAFQYDADGTYLDVLLGWTNIQLYRREELVGNTVYDVMDDEVAEQVHDTIRTALDSGEMQVLEYSVHTPGGEYRYEARAVPVPEGSGEDSVVFVARDITERYEREIQLERQNERLEEFASIVSHDLRNPLNTATGYLDLAREELDSEYLEEVADAHERMQNLVEDLLELAREGRTVENPEPVPTRELVASAWEFATGGSATLVIEDELGEVVADGPRLRQLFENLFRNSVEHAGPDVTVTVGALPDGLYVEDDGTGIPEESREKVFDPGHTSSEDGTGLGLSIVNRIVEAHGWSIEAVSPEIDEGARFEITGVEEA